MARTVWTGSLSFGLVNVPVGLAPATEDQTIHFHQLERGTGDRIRMRRVNERTGEEVALADIVKGYDLGNGDYVVVAPEELDAIAPARSKNLEISDFVDLADIDPIHFRSSYYVVPTNEGAVKAYALLARAMEATGKVGVAPLVMRNKEYLCIIRANAGMLVLETLYFNDEIRSARDTLLGVKGITDVDAVVEPELPERELKMAVQLVESLTAQWAPAEYTDTYRAEVRKLVEAKQHGEAIVSGSLDRQAAPVVDLMAALEASVRHARGSEPSVADREARARRPAAKATKKVQVRKAVEPPPAASPPRTAKKRAAPRPKAS